MPYPNSNILNIVIPQTSASLQGGQAPFVETIISGSRLILQTDNSGFLIGSSDLNLNNITASNISASGYISASNIFDSGNLTVLGNTKLGDAISDNVTITGSTSISGSVTVVGGVTGSFSGSITAADSASITNIPNTSGTYYVTFVDGTSGYKPLYVDGNILSYNANTNLLSVGEAASGSLTVGSKLTMQDIGGTSQLRVGINSTDTSSILVSANAFQVVKGTSNDRVSTNLPFSASNDSLFSGNVTVLGNTLLGDAASDVIRITGSLGLSGSVSSVSASFSDLTANRVVYTDGNKILSTDADLTFDGTTLTATNISNTNFTSSNISASNNISGSNLWIKTNITDAGTLTVVGASTLAGLTGTTATFSGLVSASAGLTASAIYDAGALTVVGNSILSNVFATNITASNISASGNISASTLRVETSIIDGGTLTVLGNTTLGDTVSDTTRITGSASISGSLTVVGTTTLQQLNITNISASGWITASSLNIVGNSLLNTITGSLSGSSISTGNATINGGTINNTPIGSTTPSTGYFTNLTASNISASTSLSASRIFVSNNLTYKESMLTGSASDFYLSASAITSSNTVMLIESSVATGSSYGLVIDSVSQSSGIGYAISASRGIIVGTVITGSSLNITGNSVLTTITGALSGSSISTGNATINGGTINGTTIGGTTPAAGTFTNLTSTGNTILGNAVSDTIQITGSTNISGSLTVIGTTTLQELNITNISASGWITASSLNITGTSTLQNTVVTSLTASSITASGNISGNNGVFSGDVAVNGGDITTTVTGTATLFNTNATTVNIGGAATGQVLLGNATGTVKSAGDLIVGSGIIKGSDAGTAVTVTSTLTTIAGDLQVNGNDIKDSGGNTNLTLGTNELTVPVDLVVSNTSNATSYIDTTAALQVAGGARISKDTWISGSLNVAGDFTVFGSSSVVYISSSTVIINDNIIQLNAYLPYERYAGFEVYDSGSNQRSASLLWDGQSDNWTTVDQNNSASNIIIGPTASFGSAIPNLTLNRLPKSYEGNAITDSKLSDDGTTLSYTGTDISASRLLSTTSSVNYISASTIIATTGSITYITGALVTYVTGSFTTLTITTGSSPGVGSQVPSSPTAAGMPGQINVDNNFIYVYTNNIWKRVPISNWSV